MTTWMMAISNDLNMVAFLVLIFGALLIISSSLAWLLLDTQEELHKAKVILVNSIFVVSVAAIVGTVMPSSKEIAEANIIKQERYEAIVNPCNHNCGHDCNQYHNQR